jgi:hypothetical protein
LTCSSSSAPCPLLECTERDQWFHVLGQWHAIEGFSWREEKSNIDQEYG